MRIAPAAWARIAAPQPKEIHMRLAHVGTLRRLTLPAGILILAAGCVDQVPTILEPGSDPLQVVITPEPRTVTVCKVGPAGSYRFSLSQVPDAVNISTWNGTALVENPFSLAAGDCADVYLGSELSDWVIVREIELPAGVSFDHVEVVLKGGTCNPDPTSPNHVYCPILYPGNLVDVIIGENGAGVVANAQTGFTLTFYNQSTTNGVGGCTPGAWRQAHWFHFWADPYTPESPLGTVFASAGLYSQNGVSLADRTMHDALQFGGGPGADGAARILLRAAVAAVLNAHSPIVEYPHSVADVVAEVDAALASGVRSTMLNLAEALDEANNGFCAISN
jgi:hypothetical protein